MLWDEVTHFTGGLLLSRGQVGMWVWTNSFYPPVYDIFVSLYYLIGGASVFAARLVSVSFSVLSLFVIYEIAKKLYNKKTALVSAILFGVMPGIVWLSRLAMIETMLIFVLSVSMLFFFRWLQTNRKRDYVISIAAFAIGAAVKYQVLVVVPLIMLLSMYFWKRDYLKAQLKSLRRPPRIALVAAAIGVVAVIFYGLSTSGLLSLLIFSIREGTQQKAVYSAMYPMPVFYLVSMTWFDSVTHPISLLLYAVGIAGLGLMALRRKREDMFLLLWFIVVYVVFTLIPNRDWRYVTIAFPVLAIAASSILVVTFDRLLKIGRTTRSLTKKWGTKIAAALLIAFVGTGVFYSCADAYNMVVQSQVQVPVDKATYYVAQSLGQNQSVAVSCPLNRFNQYMVWFYLFLKNPSQNFSEIWQYPAQAVDAYAEDFNVSQFILLCQQNNAKYVMLYEFGDSQYFNSTLTALTVCSMLNQTGQFAPAATFGTQPNRIFVFSFTQQ